MLHAPDIWSPVVVALHQTMLRTPDMPDAVTATSGTLHYNVLHMLSLIVDSLRAIYK